MYHWEEYSMSVSLKGGRVRKGDIHSPSYAPFTEAVDSQQTP